MNKHKKYLTSITSLLILVGCNPIPNEVDASVPSPASTLSPSNFPTTSPPMGTGNEDGAAGGGISPAPDAKGLLVFRYETFGNETFWTDAAKLPTGIVKAGITPVQALQLGHHVDVEALSPEIVSVVAEELKTDLSPENAPTLNDPNTTVALINANAVVGVVPIDANGDGEMDILNGDKVGISCALCHGVTDNSVFALPNGGSIGKRVDGPGAATLNVGAILATAENTRAFYPLAQLKAPGNVGLAPANVSLGPDSTEAEFDAYFSNPDYYPVGTFDVSFDGVGNPVPNNGLFGENLQPPLSGGITTLENFNNLVYTGLLDPTTLTSVHGRTVAGNQLVDDYIQVLADTGVTGYPYIQATATNQSNEASPVGFRVDEQKLQDMNSYLKTLQAPN